MNETFVIQEDTLQIVQDESDRATRPKRKPRGSRCTAIACCLLTIAIIFGFGCLFGPLVLQGDNWHDFAPSHFVIKHYRLRLAPTDAAGFQGRASIVFEVVERANEIRLLADDLHVDQMDLTLRHQVQIAGRYHVGRATNVTIGEISQINRDDRVGLSMVFAKPLQLGEYMLDIHYRARYAPGGLEKVVYKDACDARRRGDQDEAKTARKEFFRMTGASKVFPHFDSASRVPFEVSVARPTHMQCFSNVAFKEVEITKTLDGLIWEHFRPTPGIPASSLGLIVADYRSVNVRSTTSTILKIWSPVEFLHDEKLFGYAEKTLAEVFAYFQEHFEVTFPLTKLDVVLLPRSTSGFSTSPLSASRLGIITLHAEDLLLAESNNSVGRQRRVFQVLGEVVAIQFLQLFADLFAHETLIEGFAKYFTYVAEKELNDQTLWKSDEFFAENVLETSLVDMGRDKVIKMASVQRMIKDTINHQLFSSALKQWLSSNSTDNFLRILENVKLSETVDGKHLLRSWWTNSAYPIVTVMRTTGWNVLIAQESASGGSETFAIPLSFIAGDRPDAVRRDNLTLDQRQIITNLFVPRDHWLLFNYHRCGHYRVNYDITNWHQLIEQLARDASKIPVINRAALMDDAFALADAGFLWYDVPFGVVNYLRVGAERNYAPWRAGLNALNRHEGVFLDTDDYGLFRKYKVRLVSTLWPERHLLAAELNALMRDELCNLRYKPCIDDALESYNLYKYRKDVALSHEIRCAALAHSSTDEFDFLYEKAMRSWDYAELECLTCSKDASNIYRLLNETLTNMNYAKHVWSSMKSSSMGRLTGLQFLENSLTHHHRFEEDHVTEIWGIIIDEFLSSMSTNLQLITVKTMSLHLPQSLQDKVKRAVNKITEEIHWTDRHLRSFKTELLKYV